MAAYIAGPDPQDHKFICLYPECGKRFGRKYNIQSHIQTHLSDRPYRCDVCRAGFVRQHDLRRHEKIHGGDKPFVCACKKSFARQDALTRHRQRYHRAYLMGLMVGGYVLVRLRSRGRRDRRRIR
jgi:regulatory protein SWI5